MAHDKEYAIVDKVITTILIVLKIIIFSLDSLIKIFFQ